MVRTRIAPSPTGYPHIGTIYQSIFDYTLAKKYNGQFIIRIEDTDRTRLVEGAEEVVLDALEWFSLKPDEGPRNPSEKYSPYRQSERKEQGIYAILMFGGDYNNKTYKGLINRPLPMVNESELDTNNQNHYCAYYCFCKKERLDALRNEQQLKKEMPRYDKHCLGITRAEALKRKQDEEYVIRLNIPSETSIEFDDWLVGKVTVNSREIDDQVLLKSDGYPTYHFAVVVDDYLMDITHVFRGREWLTSTPKHIILYYYFNWARPIYIHLPVILNTDGKGKLSKRHGHSSVNYYKDLGYLPEAIVNYLINIVWNHPEGKEIFSLNEFKDLMHINQIEGVNTIYASTNNGINSIISLMKNSTNDIENKFTTSQGPRFDLTKLTWINQQYIQYQLTNEELKQKLIEFYPELKEDSLLDKLIPLIKTRMNTLKDFALLTAHFFTEPQITVKDEKEKIIVQQLLERMQTISEWHKDNIFQVFKQIMTENTIKMPILYALLTGKEKGLPLPESLEVLGKAKTIARLKYLA